MPSTRRRKPDTTGAKKAKEFLVGCDLCGQRVIMQSYIFHRNKCVQKLLLRGADEVEAASTDREPALKECNICKAKVLFPGYVDHVAKCEAKLRGLIDRRNDRFRKPRKQKTTKSIYGMNERQRQMKRSREYKMLQRTREIEELCRAAEVGDIESIAAVVSTIPKFGAKRGFLLRKVDSCNPKDPYGGNALMRACWAGHTNVVKALLQARADINVRTRGGGNALYFAKGQPEVRKLLKSMGARQGNPTRHQKTRMMMGIGGAPPIGGLSGVDGMRGTLPAALNLREMHKSNDKKMTKASSDPSKLKSILAMHNYPLSPNTFQVLARRSRRDRPQTRGGTGKTPRGGASTARSRASPLSKSSAFPPTSPIAARLRELERDAAILHSSRTATPRNPSIPGSNYTPLIHPNVVECDICGASCLVTSFAKHRFKCQMMHGGERTDLSRPVSRSRPSTSSGFSARSSRPSTAGGVSARTQRPRSRAAPRKARSPDSATAGEVRKLLDGMRKVFRYEGKVIDADKSAGGEQDTAATAPVISVEVKEVQSLGGWGAVAQADSASEGFEHPDALRNWLLSHLGAYASNEVLSHLWRALEKDGGRVTRQSILRTLKADDVRRALRKKRTQKRSGGPSSRPSTSSGRPRRSGPRSRPVSRDGKRGGLRPTRQGVQSHGEAEILKIEHPSPPKEKMIVCTLCNRKVPSSRYTEHLSNQCGSKKSIDMEKFSTWTPLPHFDDLA